MTEKEAFKEWKAEQYKDQSTEERLEFVEHLHTFPEYFEKTFIDGYNKANEWHYLSKGEYPKEYKDILICFITDDDTKDCVRGWYEYDIEDNKHIFKYLDVLGNQYVQYVPNVVAWKEIVLPKENE